MARTSRAEWAKRVERWRDSGLTAKEFAAETGLKASTLSYWKWRLAADTRRGEASASPNGRRTKKAKPASQPFKAPAFVEVTAVAAAPEPLELILAGDVRVRVPAGFDDDSLLRVLRAVGVRS